MPSPFPGMNPYLEQEDVWHDFHERFMPTAAEVLLPRVRPNYMIKLDSHAYIHELPARDRRLIGRPDISIVKNKPGAAGSPAVIEAPAYCQIPMAVDIERQSFMEIREIRSREIVAVVELLSPSNKKPGEDREQYLAKREAFLQSSAHLIEIDLLRGGPRLPVEPLPEGDYCVLVSRAEDRPRAGIWPIHLRDRLPTIPIPLRSPDPDASLDLQQLLNRIYDAAGYEDYAYEGLPHPPLNSEDEIWARQYVPTAIQ